MMFVRIWRFAVAEPRREAFERAYGADGDWARLFGRQEGFVATELLRGEPGVYVTIDRWRDEADWLRFRDAHDEAYRALDLECEALTLDETVIGDFVIA